jgi:radical SAM superfamily enzyme YgiQ (UPF0313 family)
MRVVLVDNLLIEQNGRRVETVLQPHLGLISLLAVVRAAGHHGHLYDPKLALTEGRLALNGSLYIEMARQIVAHSPDVVGLTSLGCNFICTLKVAQHIRTLAPSLPILLGGPHATILDKSILQRYRSFDMVVRHEAEITLPAVLEGLSTASLASIPGISYRRDDQVCVNPGAPLIDCLDNLPIPSYEDYPIDRLKLEWLRVEAGRGCPFMCTFCSTASFFGRQYRLKSAARLLFELDELNARYSVRQFSLQHDLFTVSREKVLEFCDVVAPRNYLWKCSARMDCVDPQLLSAMARAGCREIYFGVETGSPYLQRVAEKRLDLTAFYPTLDACDATGIRPTVSFITGYPQERTVDQAATLDMVGSCFYRSPAPANVQLHLMTPEPGTQLLAQFRDRLAFDGFISDFTFPTLEPDDSKVMAEAPDVFMNNHFFESVLPRRRHILVSTLYYTLYDLSPTVLSYLIDQFDGRLSALIDAFDGWATQRNFDTANGDRLVEFCRSYFGAGDPAISLVRYMAALATMIRPSRRRVVGRSAEEDLRTLHGAARVAACKLNSEAKLLRDIHDCPALLDRLEALQGVRTREEQTSELACDIPRSKTELKTWRRGAASPKLLASQIDSDWSSLVRRHRRISLRGDVVPRGDFLVVPVRGTDEVRNFRLDHDLVALLDLFRQPRSLRDFRRALKARRTPQMIRDLINIEALTTTVTQAA